MRASTPQRWSPKNKSQKNKIKTKIKIKIILTLRLTQNNQWIGVDHAARIHLLNSAPITGSVEKNKMTVMMTIMIKTIMTKEK